MTESKRLIARFMGFKYKNHEMVWMRYPKCDDSYYSKFGWICVENLMFNSSYDWLMPVVNKCLLICHENSLNEWENAFCDKFLTRDIQPLFDLCVEFIKWYNEQNK